MSLLTVVGRNPSRHLIEELRAYPEISVVGWVEYADRTSAATAST